MSRKRKLKMFGFDTETSGRFVDQGHQILTAAIVQKISESTVAKKIDIQLQVRPNAVIDDGALAVNGLNPRYYLWERDAIPYDHGQKMIENFIQSEADSESLMVGIAYNAPFDCSFFDDMFKNSYKNFNSMFDIIFDPWLLVKKLVKEKKLITPEIMSKTSTKPYRSTKMQDVAETLNTKAQGLAHSALADTLTMFLTVEALWVIYTGRSFYTATAEELAPFTLEAKNLMEENERMSVS